MIIGKHIIGERVFVIAEAGVNHNGNVELAMRLIDAAVAAGADAVKFQAFDPDELVTAEAAKADYQKSTTDSGESQRAMLKRLALSQEDFRTLAVYAAGHDILFMATPFDLKSAEFLVSIGMPAIKVPSGEITNLPFLKKLTAFRVPMIVSTGMSAMDEIREAVEVLNPNPFALLHCVSAYPAPIGEIQLKAMITMREAFRTPVGYSDHTDGIDIALAAVSLGAEIIEKHITLDRNMPGPDHQASLEPPRFAEMVHAIRRIEKALGTGIKQAQPCERNTAEVARRSLVAGLPLSAGETLSRESIAIKRPGTGIAPKFLEQAIGKKTLRAVREGEPLQWEMLV